MSNRKLPSSPSKSSDISDFLDGANQLRQRTDSKTKTHGRLIFALDATASRQASWDRACHLQATMFTAAEQNGGLELQLCYYRGIQELHSSIWMTNSHMLLNMMNSVSCLGGYSQIERVLNHALAENAQTAINAVIFIGDAVEEDVDKLCGKAGQLGLKGVPLFIFQEGYDPTARQCFQQMAHLSNGAYAIFDENSADQLRELLKAVATFASGGYDALERLQSSAAKSLLAQLKA